MCSNAFAAQLKCMRLTVEGSKQPVHGKRCFTIGSALRKSVGLYYVGMVLSVGFFSKQLPVQGLLTDEYLSPSVNIMRGKAFSIQNKALTVTLFLFPRHFVK